ncbi:MAG: hypothetical protein MK180_14690 [Rhodobacteraceae bacterium]|nr:hypothetical protein [Paracoccaceae bacterium]
MNTQDTPSMDEQARAILRGNDRGGYTVPTAGLYPYQWNWDSAFAAWGFATFDLPRAWAEMDTLFTGQWDNGMVPHILFHKADPGYFPGPDVWSGIGPIPSSGISQPPVAASFARRVYDMDPEAGRSHMAELFPKMAAWHRWFMHWRLDQGAVCITHPWEAGRDNTPDWDGAMAGIDPVGVGEYTRRDTSHVDPSMRPTKYDYDRYIWLVQLGRRLNWDEAALLKENPFRVADPTMTFILLRAQRDLAYLGRELGEDVSEIDAAIATLEAGAETLWNPTIGCYDARDARSGEWADCVSNASFLCWYAGLDHPEMEAQYDRITSICTYPVPSHDPSSERFDAKRYWRGPTWGIMNALIGMGLEERGLTQRAAELREATADVITRHGFAEYFDPHTGGAAGGGTFTWTAAIWLAWASPSQGQA